MLVLTRKQNEKIRIGNDVTVTVVRTKGKTVRLGIEAPEHLRVLRGEIVFDLDDDVPEQRDHNPRSAAAETMQPTNRVAACAQAATEGAWTSDERRQKHPRDARRGWQNDPAPEGPLRSMVKSRATH